jgi:hypothetical protein
VDKQRCCSQPEVSFEDQTREIVGHAERLVEKNEREDAGLDQKWYGFRRFGEYQELLLGAERVLFYGGLETDVHTHIRGQYLSVTPLAENRDPGEIRLFAGRLEGGKWDYIVVGQNGREVALKTIFGSSTLQNSPTRTSSARIVQDGARSASRSTQPTKRTGPRFW